jgi:hypothetical protein
MLPLHKFTASLGEREFEQGRKIVKIIPSDKLLLILQFWNGDKEQAMQLARLLADIEPAHNGIADFLFVSRFDTSHDQATIKHVSRKFNTFSYVSKGRGTGWPAGCNDLLFGALGWVYHKKRAAQIPGYKAVFCFEADGIPMCKDWIAGLRREWTRVNSLYPVFQAGAWLPNGPDNIGTGHINGNCLLSGNLEFLRWLTTNARGINSNAGWDWVLSPKFKERGWADIPKIRSMWRTPMTEEIFLIGMAEGRIWHHGIKDDAGIKLCRKYLI